jgi:hypothetical protein
MNDKINIVISTSLLVLTQNHLVLVSFSIFAFTRESKSIISECGECAAESVFGRNVVMTCAHLENDKPCVVGVVLALLLVGNGSSHNLLKALGAFQVLLACTFLPETC